MSAIERKRKTIEGGESRLPKSRKVYVEGSSPGVRVPFREIELQRTTNSRGLSEVNQPVRVYDTSGPWEDPEVKCDTTFGLPPLRRPWIEARADVVEYEGRAR